MRKREIGIMNKNSQSIITSYALEQYQDSQRTTKLPMKYLDKMFSYNQVFCYHCDKVIPIGTEFASNRHSRGRNKVIRKYYHKSCWDRMFY